MSPVLPSGWRDASCPRCGQAFACGAGAERAQPCWCAGIALAPALLAQLRERWSDCLCERCLRTLAEDAGRPS